MNPPNSLPSTGLVPQQTAVADTATLVSKATFNPYVQALLTAEGYSQGNNWNYFPNVVTLSNTATFNITQYNLFLNGAGTAFGENMGFTLNPNLNGPQIVPGSVATEHWLQVFNMSMANANGHAGQSLAAPNNMGFWYNDNGFATGMTVDGTNNGAGTNNGSNGPYYDSNNVPATSGMTFSTPPDFFDGPQFFSGVGFYIHFLAIPTWDVYTPAANGNPATDSIEVGNYGVMWGFSIVPEPSSVSLLMVALVCLVGFIWRRTR